MIIKKVILFVASIIKLFILLFYFTINCIADEISSKRYSADEGVLSIMYHRFNESKYPSTNIQMEVFRKHINMIIESGFSFYNPKNFEKEFSKPKTNKKILLTIDDAFRSFYTEAWPYLKKNEIPFILFVSTKPVGKNGYMTWEQIKEIEIEKFAMIGHHSHSHEHLIDKTYEEFILDIETADKIFKENLGYVPKMFSYPFGEYSKKMKDYVSKNFNLGFGQHSGVIDNNKEKFELPRFPINEKYGELKRFKSIVSYSPLEYKILKPEEKKLINSKNPPSFSVEFFDNQENINNINCFSNEGGKWEKSQVKFQKNKLSITFREPFKPRRGRVNCSLNDNGKWRWFGTQFTVKN